MKVGRRGDHFIASASSVGQCRLGDHAPRGGGHQRLLLLRASRQELPRRDLCARPSLVPANNGRTQRNARTGGRRVHASENVGRHGTCPAPECSAQVSFVLGVTWASAVAALALTALSGSSRWMFLCAPGGLVAIATGVFMLHDRTGTVSQVSALRLTDSRSMARRLRSSPHPVAVRGRRPSPVSRPF
jgi:hypothetical protein